jgi:predicted esterase
MNPKQASSASKASRRSASRPPTRPGGEPRRALARAGIALALLAGVAATSPASEVAPGAPASAAAAPAPEGSPGDTPAAQSLPANAGAAVTASAPGGRLVERVEVGDAAGHAYQVFLPSSYDGERPHPAILLLDARKGAGVPIAAYHDAAERYGWVLLSSWDSFSDGDPWPTVEAVRAVGPHALTHYRIDPERIAIAGFSGTARIASWIAASEPRPFLAVVAAGAGFAETVQATAELPFPWIATIGDRDFNYREVLARESELRGFSLPHAVEVFAGPHRWPPAEVTPAVFQWLELLAMRRGKRPADAALVAQWWEERLARAAAAEAASDPLLAERLYRGLVADFAGLRDTTAASDALARVVAAPAHAAAVRDDARLAERERDLIRGAQRVLAGLDLSETTPRGLASRLGGDKLRKLARSDDPVEAALGYRVLSALVGQVGFYLPTDAERRGNPRLADLLRKTAAVLRGE